jgi:polyisoprenoid-binding protein YceI
MRYTIAIQLSSGGFMLRFLIIAAVSVLPFSAAFAAGDFTPPSKEVAKAEAGLYTLDTTHASIVFGISHLGFSTYQGRFNSFDAKLNFKPEDPTKSTLEVTIQPASVDVKNSELEAKLLDKDFFDAKTFPEAKFVATSIVKTGEDKGKMTGNFTLKGVTKPLTLDVVFNGHGANPFSGGKMLGFSATGSFKRSDFGMSAYVPAVGDDVKLTIEVEFAKAS